MQTRNSSRRPTFAALLIALGLVVTTLGFANPASAAPPTYVVAGDDPNATGDQWGLHESYYSDLRATITDPARFGASGTVNAVFTIGTPRPVPLVAHALDGVNVYFLSARDVAPGEVAVLQSFIASGGALIVNSNAPGFFDATSWLGFTLSPRVVYGDGAAPYTSTHRAPSPSSVVAGQAGHPVVSGPFGAVNTFENWHSVAGFTTTPASATVLARTTLTGPDNNGSATNITITNVATLAVIPAGASGAGSGPVIATSDVDTYSNAYTAGIGYPTDSLCTLNGTTNGTLARDSFAWIAAQLSVVVPPTTTAVPVTTTTLPATTTAPGTTSTTLVGGSTTSTSAPGTSTTTAPVTTTTTTPTSGPAGLVALIEPVRVLDTRSALGGPAARFGGREQRSFTLGTAGVPADATMVVVNITAAAPSGAGYLTAFPAGSALPETSSVNFSTGQTIANAAFVKIGVGGRIAIFNANGATDVLVDVTGYFAPGGARFVNVEPARLKDTRSGLGGTGITSAATTQRLVVAGRSGVPVGATAVALNVTAVDPTAATYLTVWPADRTRPDVSSINTTPGITIPNLVIARLPTAGSTAGAIDLYNAVGDTHMLVDVVGYFTNAPPAGGVDAVDPHRLVDTRGTHDPLAAGTSRAFTTAMAGATAVVLNITAVDPTAAGFFTAFAGTGPQPDTSNINFVPGQAAPNLVIVHPTADGTVRVYNSAGTTHLIVDIIARLD